MVFEPSSPLEEQGDEFVVTDKQQTRDLDDPAHVDISTYTSQQPAEAQEAGLSGGITGQHQEQRDIAMQHPEGSMMYEDAAQIPPAPSSEGQEVAASQNDGHELPEDPLGTDQPLSTPRPSPGPSPVQARHNHVQVDQDEPQQPTAAATVPRSGSVHAEVAANQPGDDHTPTPTIPSSLPADVRLQAQVAKEHSAERKASPFCLSSGEAPAQAASGQTGGEQPQGACSSPGQQGHEQGLEDPLASPDMEDIPPHSPLPFPKVTDLPDLLEGDDMEEELQSPLRAGLLSMGPTAGMAQELSVRLAKRKAGLHGSGTRSPQLLGRKRSLTMAACPGQDGNLGEPIGGLHYPSDQQGWGSQPMQRMRATLTSQVGYMPHGEGEAPALILPHPQAGGPQVLHREAVLHPAAVAAGMDVHQGAPPSTTRPHPHPQSHPHPFPPTHLSQLSPSSGMLRSLNKRPHPRSWLPGKWAAGNPKRLTKKLQDGKEERRFEGFHGMFDSDPEDMGDPTGNPALAYLSELAGGGSGWEPPTEQGAAREEPPPPSLLMGPMGGLQRKLQKLAHGGALSSTGLTALIEPGKRASSVFQKPRHKQAPRRGAAAEHPLQETGWVPHRTMHSVIHKPESSAGQLQDSDTMHEGGSAPLEPVHVEEPIQQAIGPEGDPTAPKGNQQRGGPGAPKSLQAPPEQPTRLQQVQHEGQAPESDLLHVAMSQPLPSQQPSTDLVPPQHVELANPTTSQQSGSATLLQPRAADEPGWLQARYALKRSLSGRQLLLQPHSSHPASQLSQRDSRLERAVTNLLQRGGSGRQGLVQRDEQDQASGVPMSPQGEAASRSALQPVRNQTQDQALSGPMSPQGEAASRSALQPVRNETQDQASGQGLLPMQPEGQAPPALETSMGWASRRLGGHPAQVELVRDLRDIIEELIEDLPMGKRHHFQDRVHTSLQQARHWQQAPTELQGPFTHSAPPTPVHQLQAPTTTQSDATTPVHQRIPQSQPTPSMFNCAAEYGPAASFSHAGAVSDAQAPEHMQLLPSPPAHRPIHFYHSNHSSPLRSSPSQGGAAHDPDPALAAEPSRNLQHTETTPSSTATHPIPKPIALIADVAAKTPRPLGLLTCKADAPAPPSTLAGSKPGSETRTPAPSPKAAADGSTQQLHPSTVTSAHPTCSMQTQAPSKSQAKAQPQL